jgi:hypothetical protein
VHDNLQSSDKREVPSHTTGKENVGKHHAPEDGFEKYLYKLSKPYNPPGIV